jgi:glucoamylase
VVKAVPRLPRDRRHEFDIVKRSASSFLETEVPIALADLLCNIGSAGSCAAGADSGIVIASPSKTNPDCKYCLISSHAASY